MGLKEFFKNKRMYTLITSWISKNIFLSISFPEKHLQVTALLFLFLIVHSWSVSAHHISHGFPLKWYHFHCLNSLHRRTTGRRINCLGQQQWQCTREMSQGLRGGQDAFRKELLPNITEGAQESLLSPRHPHLNIERPHNRRFPSEPVRSTCPSILLPWCRPSLPPWIPSWAPASTQPSPPGSRQNASPSSHTVAEICASDSSFSGWDLNSWSQNLRPSEI